MEAIMDSIEDLAEKSQIQNDSGQVMYINYSNK